MSTNRVTDRPPTLDDRSRRLVSGLARNPAAPTAVLLKIIRVPHVAAEMTYRRSPLADDLAEALIALGDHHVTSLLDREGRASPAIRERLARGVYPSVRAAIATQVRGWLGSGAFVPLDMLEKLSNTDGVATWAELAGDPDPKVRAAIARAWFDPPDDVWRALMNDPEPSVRAAVSQNRPVPFDLQSQFLADPATRARVAGYAELTDQMALELADDADEDVRCAVASNPQLTEVAVRRLADRGPLCWGDLICNPATPEGIRARLHEDLAAMIAELDHSRISARYVDATFANAALLYPQMQWFRQLALTDRLAHLDSPYAFFRRALAQHDDLPPDAVERLRNDQDREVRRTMARKPDAPGHFVEKVFRECGNDAKFRPQLSDHPNFPRTGFARYADEDDPRLRRFACHDPLLPASVVARLSRDADVWVRRSTAALPNLPLDDLLRLLEDEDPHVVEEAAASPTLPVALMQQIADRAAQAVPTS